jgi:hypothetical protein
MALTFFAILTLDFNLLFWELIQEFKLVFLFVEGLLSLCIFNVMHQED